jgi:hypothetical protein
MAAMSWGSVGAPAFSESFVALTMTMNRLLLFLSAVLSVPFVLLL